MRSMTLALASGAIAAAALNATPADLPFGFTPPPTTAPLPASPPRITLVWFDLLRELPTGSHDVADEVRAIFAELGIEVTWRQGEPGTSYGGTRELEIAVIALAEDPSPTRRSRTILGLVQREPRPTRTVWAFMGNIKRAVGHDPEAAREVHPVEQRLLARAVGRVIAHEVVHAVAPEHPHDRRGLMRHALSRTLLVGVRAPLGDDCARAVRAGVAAWQGPRPADT
jgi:hypothetical protein